MKRKWILLIVSILLFALILIGYTLSTIFLLAKDISDADIIIGAIGGGVSFIGTISLGIVAYWQTRTANDISRAQLRRELITNMILLPETSIRVIDLQVKKILTQFQGLSQEGIYCSTDELENIEENDERRFFEFSFQFKTEGAPLEALYPKEIKINQELLQELKSFAVDLKILNRREDAIFVFDPDEGTYRLKVLLNAPVDKLIEISENKMFVLNISFDAVSIYGTRQENRWAINFDQEVVKISELEKGLPKQDIRIKNVIIHKGDPEYERK